MGIAAVVKAVEKNRPEPTVTIEVDGEECRFRAPKIADMEQAAQIAKALEEEHDTLGVGRVNEIALLGVCYLPAKSERGVDALKAAAALARIADGDEFVFVKLRDAFFAAYPGFVEWIANRALAFERLMKQPEEAHEAPQEETAADPPPVEPVADVLPTQDEKQ